MSFNKYTPVFAAVFLFPITIATVNHGGGVFFLLIFLLGLFLGWPAWRSLEAWEKWVLLGFFAFIVLIGLSLFNTQDMYSGAKRIEKYLLFLFFIPMYLLFKEYRVVTGKIYLLGLIVASLVMFVQAYYQTTILGLHRATGGYSSLIIGDTAMLVVVVVNCALLTVYTNWWHYFLGFLVIGIALTTSVMSGSVGSWILLPVMIVWFLWVKRKNLGIFSLIVTVIMTSVLIWGGISVDKVKNRVSAVIQSQNFTPNSTKINSAGARLEMWRDSINIWKEYPLIGTGIGDFRTDRFRLFKNKRSRLSTKYKHAHNIYFDTLATSGLVGLLALLVFAQLVPFLIFRFFWLKEQDPWIQFYALSGMATIIAFAVFGLTECWLARNPFVRTYLMSILVFMSSIAVVRNSRRPEIESHKSP